MQTNAYEVVKGSYLPTTQTAQNLKSKVTDTPGLLRRHDEKRNNLEKLTLAVLSHLPTAILYVHDLSGECATSDQYLIYKEFKERFNGHLWLDVISKSDLLQESPVVFVSEDTTVDDDEMVQYRKEGPDGAIHVSVKSERGLIAKAKCSQAASCSDRQD